jgi:hypothetical protein
MIPLSAIVEAARILSVAAPLLTEALRAIGCAIEGCAEDTHPQPADIPTGEAGLDALSRLRARAAGLDARGLRDRGMPSQDYDELPRTARAEKLAEGVVVIRRRPA